jgi:hypothetical protein
MGLRKTDSDNSDFALASLLAVGCASNSLQTPFLAESANGGANWTVPTIMDAPQYGCLNSAASIVSAQESVSIATGSDNTDTYSPLIIQKRGSGNWTRVPLPGIKPYGYFMSASCASAKSTDICVAAGYYFDNVPVLAQGISGNWSLAKMPDKRIYELIASSCVASDYTDIHCFAVGSSTSNIGIILHSTNGGNWELALSVPGGHFDRISCFTASKTGFACVAAGSPFAETTDGVQWTTQSVLSDFSAFRAVSCVSLESDNCVAAGFTIDSGLIVQRINGTWIRQDLPSITNASLNGVSCIDDGSQEGLCLAVGGILKKPVPIIGQWNGSWSFINATSSGSLYTVSCAAEGNNTICLAGGEGAPIAHNEDSRSPLLLERGPNGEWLNVSISSIPKQSLYVGTDAFIFSKQQNLLYEEALTLG